MKINAPNRRLWITAIRLLFVASVILFGWWSLQGEWPAVLAAAGQVTAPRLMAAISLVLAGLLCTGIVWQRVLLGYGYRLPVLRGFSVFFVGQLGKYIPGSVWSLAAQGEMARRFNVPVRTTVATGLIFLYWNLTTATFLSAVLTLLGDIPVDVPTWVSITVAGTAVAAMAPITVTTLANKMAGTHNPHHTRLRDTSLLAPLMLLTWASYGVAMICVAPEGKLINSSGLGVTYSIAVFAIAYVLGVLVPLAPAGFGIREATLTFLLAPALGVPAAAAIALLTRAIHTIADFSIAGISGLTARLARN